MKHKKTILLHAQVPKSPCVSILLKHKNPDVYRKQCHMGWANTLLPLLKASLAFSFLMLYNCTYIHDWILCPSITRHECISYVVHCYPLVIKQEHQETDILTNAAHHFLITVYFLCTALDHYVHPVLVNRTEKEHMNKTCTQFSNTWTADRQTHNIQ